MHRKFAGAHAEEISFHSDDVAYIEQLVEFEVAFLERIDFDIDMQFCAVLREVHEARFALAAQRLNAS